MGGQSYRKMFRHHRAQPCENFLWILFLFNLSFFYFFKIKAKIMHRRKNSKKYKEIIHLVLCIRMINWYFVLICRCRLLYNNLFNIHTVLVHKQYTTPTGLSRLLLLWTCKVIEEFIICMITYINFICRDNKLSLENFRYVFFKPDIIKCGSYCHQIS